LKSGAPVEEDTGRGLDPDRDLRLAGGVVCGEEGMGVVADTEAIAAGGGGTSTVGALAAGRLARSSRPTGGRSTSDVEAFGAADRRAR
jgi:hypothetical protein